MIRVMLILALLTGCSTTSAQRLHINGGIMAGGMTYTITENPHYACLASATVGAAKELYDATGRGHATLSDVAYTALPSCVGFYIVDRWVRGRR